MDCFGSDFITWSLVLLGWYIVHRATLSRDRRKEKRENSIQFCKDILDLQSKAIDFHTAVSFDARKSTDIAQQIERIVLKLQKPPLNELKIDQSCFINLRRAITQRNIDLSDFKPQSVDSEIIYSIRESVDDLLIAIEDQREVEWN